MPALSPRLATTVVCTTLLVGVLGPVTATALSTTHPVQSTQARAPEPADAVAAQVQSLQDMGGVATPVTDLLELVLGAKDGPLPLEDIEAQAAKVKEAIDAALPVDVPAPITSSAAPTETATTAPESSAPADGKARADLQDDALKALQSAVDALVAAAKAGDAVKATAQVPVVVTSLVNVLAATLLGGGLPAPNLPGLPQLPGLPTPDLPTPDLPVPSASDLPVPSTSGLPVPSTSGLPQLPLSP